MITQTAEDEPRLWEQDYGGPEPEGVVEVIDRDGDRWYRTRPNIWGGHPGLSAIGISWGSLTAYGPLVEVLKGAES